MRPGNNRIHYHATNTPAGPSVKVDKRGGSVRRLDQKRMASCKPLLRGRHRRAAHTEACGGRETCSFFGRSVFLPKNPVWLTTSGDMRNFPRMLRKAFRSWSVEL